MIYEFDPYKKNCQGEYVFSGRDNYSHERWCVDFEDLIVIMFNEKILMIYILVVIILI